MVCTVSHRVDQAFLVSAVGVALKMKYGSPVSVGFL